MRARFLVCWIVLLSAVPASAFDATEVAADDSAVTDSTCNWWYKATEGTIYGPEQWWHCSETCRTGVRQSPIDIVSTVPGTEGEILLKWSAIQTLSVRSDGHSIVATPTVIAPDGIKFNGTWYTLQQLHFHVGSEHKIRGTAKPAELHFVTTDKSTPPNYLVIAVLLDFGATLPGDDYFRLIPLVAARGGGNVTIDALTTLLPPLKPALTITSYYTYPGSLTTPGCTETVQFALLKSPRTLSIGTLGTLLSTSQSLLGGENARPVQPLGNRTVHAIPSD